MDIRQWIRFKNVEVLKTNSAVATLTGDQDSRNSAERIIAAVGTIVRCRSRWRRCLENRATRSQMSNVPRTLDGVTSTNGGRQCRPTIKANSDEAEGL